MTFHFCHRTFLIVLVFFSTVTLSKSLRSSNTILPFVVTTTAPAAPPPHNLYIHHKWHLKAFLWKRGGMGRTRIPLHAAQQQQQQQQNDGEDESFFSSSSSESNNDSDNDHYLDLTRAIACAEHPGACSVEEILNITLELEKKRRKPPLHALSPANEAYIAERDRIEGRLLGQLYAMIEENETMMEATRMERADLGRGRNDFREMIREEHLHVVDLRAEQQSWRDEEEEWEQFLSQGNVDST